MRPDKAAIVLGCVLACVLAGSSEVVWAAKAKGKPKASSSAAAETEGRKHAHKADHLADINKCKLAIPEYGKALRLLKGKDPTLLFNRAECYRRTGDSAKAVADYRKFLVELPAAPNRAQVESQIAALSKPGAAPSLASAPSAVAVAPSPDEVPPERQERPIEERQPEPRRPGRLDDSRSRELDRPPPPVSAGRVAAAPSAPVAPHSAPALAENDAPMAMVDTRPRADTSADSERGSSRWWIWVVGAVVVAGGAVGAYVALNQGKTDVPTSALGNYKF